MIASALLSILVGSLASAAPSAPWLSALAPAVGQDEAAADATTAAPGGLSDEQLAWLKQAIHYILIAKPDLAASFLTKLSESSPTPEQLAVSVDSGEIAERVERAMSLGRYMDIVGPQVRQLELALEAGRLALCREDSRIEAAVAMLVGTLRERALGEDRLHAAGDYAMPALLRALQQTQDSALQLRAAERIRALNSMAVPALCAALLESDRATRTAIVKLLNEIGWSTAAPFLLEVAEDPALPADLRNGAREAAKTLVDDPAALTAATQYIVVARQYFAAGSDTAPFVAHGPTDPIHHVWSYDPHVGLMRTPVPTPIYRQVIAMQLARRALALDPSSRLALAYFVAADLRRENLLAEGAVDPVFGSERFPAQFYATAAGPSVLEVVLDLALQSGDAKLALRAIDGLAFTAGLTNLFEPLSDFGGEEPVPAALAFPQIDVRFRAALVLVNAMPRQPFVGHADVVPILAAMVAEGPARRGMVIASSSEERESLDQALTAVGYRTAVSGADFSQLTAQLGAARGVEVILLSGAPSSTLSAMRLLRANRLTQNAPVVVVCTQADRETISKALAGDCRALVSSHEVGSAEFAEDVAQIEAAAFGGQISQPDVVAQTADALTALARIGDAGRPDVFSLRTAESPLLGAINQASGALRLEIAQVVARIDSAQAQRALMALALAATDDERVGLLNAAAASARRFGNLLDPGQITALRVSIHQGGQAAAETVAAGELYGALNLPADETVQLILGRE